MKTLMSISDGSTLILSSGWKLYAFYLEFIWLDDKNDVIFGLDDSTYASVG
jgi:hypothetical protein